MLRSQRTNILYHNQTLIFALMRSSVAETVPTQHVREVDYQLTRVKWHPSGNNTSSFDSSACVRYYCSAPDSTQRGILRASDPNDHRGTCLLYARCQIRTYPSPSVRWQTRVLEPTSTIGFPVSWCNISFMGYLSGRFRRSGQVCIV